VLAGALDAENFGHSRVKLARAEPPFKPRRFPEAVLR
jgi:hypothetical protein